MALTREFIEAVTQGNLLRVRIMLKDSLLVDTSFGQFNEMSRYAESRLKNLWISDEEDDEEFSQSTEELNNILVGLVNNFSKRRVTHLKGLIRKIYPPKQDSASHDNLHRGTTVIIRKTKTVVAECNALLQDKRTINEACKSIVSKNQINTSDIAKIRRAAMNIIEHCDKISGK